MAQPGTRSAGVVSDSICGHDSLIRHPTTAYDAEADLQATLCDRPFRLTRAHMWPVTCYLKAMITLCLRAP
jgi:hypothetical protein